MKPEKYIGPATDDDLDFFSRGQEWPTVRAWVAKLDGVPVALFGLARAVDARWYAFFDITDAARPYKMTIVKTARMVMDEAQRMGLRYVYAVPDDREPLAMRWMQTLGFRPDPRSHILMRWENKGAT